MEAVKKLIEISYAISSDRKKANEENFKNYHDDNEEAIKEAKINETKKQKMKRKFYNSQYKNSKNSEIYR